MLRFLKGKNIPLLLTEKKNSHDFVAYSDSVWAASSDRKSTFHYAIFCFGSIISWDTRKQHSVSLSSIKAEYFAASETSTTCVWVFNIFKDVKKAVEFFDLLLTIKKLLPLQKGKVSTKQASILIYEFTSCVI